MAFPRHGSGGRQNVFQPTVGWLDRAILTSKLVPNTFPNILVIPELSSTNAHARQCLEHELPCLIVCETQTTGRGRLERGWLSAPGCSLTFSLVVRLERASPAGLSLVVASGIASCLAQHGCNVGVKWPNDLLDHDGGKLGGILVEIVEQSAMAIIGIGVNLWPFPALKQHEPTAGWVFANIRPMECNGLLADLAVAILAEIAHWQLNDWASCRNRWLEHCVHHAGDKMLVTVPGGQRELLHFAGIGDHGQLLATSVVGQVWEIACGEIIDASSD